MHNIQKPHHPGQVAIRALMETAISRIKRINDGRLISRTFGTQQNEVAIYIAIANRNMQVARPLTRRVR